MRYWISALIFRSLQDLLDLLLQAFHLFHGPVVLVADLGLDALVLLGMEVHEGHVLQLVADLAHAQAVGDGGVDLQGFAGDLDPLFRRLRWARVRMLCRRSASLIRMTRTSAVMAMIIFFSVSAWASSTSTSEILEILVTPQTMSLISWPKSLVRSSRRVLRILDHVVQQAGGDGDFVQLHVGQDRRPRSAGG